MNYDAQMSLPVITKGRKEERNKIRSQKEREIKDKIISLLSFLPFPMPVKKSVRKFLKSREKIKEEKTKKQKK